LQQQQGLHAPLDPFDGNFQSKEMYHNTTSMGTQIPKENCKKRKKDNYQNMRNGNGREKR
jgi:hypothetical protein